MADQRITQLTALPKASVAATDVLPIADVSASQTKKVTAKDLVDAGLDLVDASSIDLSKLDQASATKLATAALADDAITGAKLADGSSVVVSASAPTTDNFEGRGWLNSSTGELRIFRSGAFGAVAAVIADGGVTTAKLADGAVTTAKASNLGTAALANGAVTYAKIQNTSGTNVLLGRSTAGAGTVEEITCTAAGRALIDDADAAAQRTTLGLGTLATQNGTYSGTHSGTSSGTNTGDQTITLTGDVTGSGTGSFAATIASGAVTEAKLGSSAVSTTKVADDAITAAKLADQSAAIVAAATPSGSGSFVGQQWLNTNTGIEYTWTGSAWLRQASLGTISFSDSTPLAFSVAYPDAYSATITTTLDTQSAARVFAGPTSGADAAPTFRALVPGDLPDATASTKGVIQPGTGLSVSSGTLNHSNSTTAGTYPKVTVDAQGHVTAGTTLSASDIPVLDASKITTGTFGTALIADDAVTGLKLANYSTAKFGEALPIADFIGQIFFNPLDESFFLWDGNVWQPLGISAGSVIFAGTYNANTNRLATVTTEGAAIGLTVGNALPSASSGNSGYYVVVSTSGTGTAPAPTTALAPPDMILSNGTVWTEIDVSSTYIAQSAGNVSFAAAGQISSTNVQAAIEEVSSECRNADNITSGTLLAARGGTGNASYTKGDLLAASGTTALSKLGVGTNGQVLRANSATATGLEWGADFVGTVTSVSGSGAISVANGTTTPAISVAAASTSVAGVVQLSDSTGTTSSVLAATPTAVKSAYDLANAAMPKTGGTFTGDITMGASVGIQFEGSTDDANETRLLAADPTADRLIYLPNADGTLVLSGAIVNADIAAGAAIAGTKISPDFGSQNRTSTGTSTAASFIPTSSTAPTNGVYLPAANSVALATNGAGRLFIDANGSVGIGAGADLVNSSVHLVRGASAAAYMAFTGNANTITSAGLLVGQSAGGESRLFQYGNNPITFYTQSLERLRITGNGNVGIGTVSPSSTLTVGGNPPVAGAIAAVGSSGGIALALSDNVNSSLYVRTAAGGAVIGTDGSGIIRFATNGNTTTDEKIRIDNAGRLLVGATLARSTFLGAAISAGIQVEAAGNLAANNRAISIVHGNSASTDGDPILYLGRTRSGTVGGTAAVANGDNVGRVEFVGSDGTNMLSCARIIANIDGDVGTNDVPGRLIFATTADGAASPTERMRISSNGRVTLANSSVGTPTALTDAATITPDFAVANHFTVTLAGNRTLANPTNLTAGQSGVIVITQDATGSRTLAFGSNWKFPGGTAPTLTTTASAVDVLVYYVESATRISTRLISDTK